MNFLFKIFSKIFPIAEDVVRNRLLNKQTPKGILLLLVGLFGFNLLDEKKVNFIISLLSHNNITWVDFYIVLVNLLVIFLITMGCWLIFSKVKNYSKHKVTRHYKK